MTGNSTTNLVRLVSRSVGVLLLTLSVSAADDSNAVKKLSGTPIFAFGGIGYAGTTSEGEVAFKAVLASVSAEADFLRLLKSGNPQAKCYALVGLRVTSRQAFNEQLKTFASSNQEVQTCAGCNMARQPMSSVVASIQRGDYDERANSKSVQPR